MEKLKYRDYEIICILQNVDTGKQYDITKIITEATYTTELMTGAAGKLELFLLNKRNATDLNFLRMARQGQDEKHGHAVTLTVDGEGVFMGYVTNVEITQEHIFKVTAQDSIFWLKSKDILYTEEMTASDIFSDVASRKANISHSVKTAASAILTPFDYANNYTMFAMIEHAINLANVEERKQYLIRDEFGTLVFTELSELHSGLTLGDYEYMTTYKYNSTIAERSYNHVRAYRPNEDLGMFDTWLAKDSASIERWGQLNFLFEVDKEKTDAEIMDLAEKKLAFFNVPTETISITALGHIGVYAGNGVKLKIDSIELVGNFWATRAKHTFRNNYHTMDLEMFYVADS
ncbi:MAG: hypothetical protein FWG64_12970 [Firmicutes bacterium]|nr:hypothetical protein [Bacillota bacterium]